MTGGEDELAERLLRCESNSPDRPGTELRRRLLCGCLLQSRRVRQQLPLNSALPNRR